MLEFATLIKEAICVANLVIINTLAKDFIKDQILVWYSSNPFAFESEKFKICRMKGALSVDRLKLLIRNRQARRIDGRIFFLTTRISTADTFSFPSPLLLSFVKYDSTSVTINCAFLRAALLSPSWSCPKIPQHCPPNAEIAELEELCHTMGPSAWRSVLL